MKKFVVLLVSVLQIHLLQAQSFPEFKNESVFYKTNRQTRGIFAAGFVDVNGDFIDDLVSVNKGFEYSILLGNASRKPLFPGNNFTFSHFFDAFGLAVADLNGDFIPDFVTGGSFGYLHVLVSTSGGGFEQILLPSDFLVQTINIADVNQDNFPDIFVCNDNGPNTVFINNGQGQFTENESLINFTTNPVSDMSGNYGSVWADVNLDNRPDLAIAKCKAGVSSPADPRRINRLFIQQPDGSFRDEAEKYNFALGEQSWAVAFGDLDNDGDMDAFVANHYDPHVLLENINGERFEMVQLGQNAVSSFAFQVVMRDFDNDGWLDIALSGLEGLSFLHNQKDLKFEYIQTFNTPLPGMSITAGDINDDGRIDLHTTLHQPLNFPGNSDDRLYINQEKRNHYIKCNLLPGPGSKTAIGAKTELFGPWGIQTRLISAGEGFGVTNSAQVHFGIAGHLKADSVRVTWPSGQVDVFPDLDADQTWLLQENTCASPVLSYFASSIILDTLAGVKLEGPEGFSSYHWSDGASSRVHTVYDEGQYFVVMTDESGCLHYSKPVYLDRGCFQPGLKLLTDDADFRVACSGDSVALNAISSKQYSWSTGDTIQNLVIRQSGLYKLSVTDFCGMTREDSVLVHFEWVQTPIITFPDTVPSGSAITLVSSDENTVWLNSQTMDVEGYGASFSVLVGDKDTSFLASAYQETEARIQSSGMQQYPAENQYGSNAINGGLVFNVEKELVLRRVTVFTDTPGKRKIIILDHSGQRVFEKEFFVRFGTNKLDLEAPLLPGNNYILTTDGAFNLAELGFSGPRFRRHFNHQDINYPYEIADVMTITESSSGLNYYYYFYEWEVSFDFLTCFSDPVYISISVDTSTGTRTPVQETGNLLVFPNPADDQIIVTIPDFHPGSNLEIVSVQGEVIYSANPIPGNLTIRTFDWKPGMYFVKWKSAGGGRFQKLIKI